MPLALRAHSLKYRLSLPLLLIAPVVAVVLVAAVLAVSSSSLHSRPQQLAVLLCQLAYFLVSSTCANFHVASFFVSKEFWRFVIFY